MRISDWSSDVCSSDLAAGGGAAALVEGAASLAGQKRDDFLREQVRQGGILLWVKLHEIDEVDEARAILTRNGASEIHVHPVASQRRDDPDGKAGPRSGGTCSRR